MLTKVSSDYMEKKKAAEIGRVTAAGTRAVASARSTLMARLGAKELAASEDEKASIETTVEAARVVVRAEEQKMERAIDEVSNKWDDLIEKRTR